MAGRTRLSGHHSRRKLLKNNRDYQQFNLADQQEGAPRPKEPNDPKAQTPPAAPQESPVKENPDNPQSPNAPTPPGQPPPDPLPDPLKSPPTSPVTPSSGVSLNQSIECRKLGILSFVCRASGEVNTPNPNLKVRAASVFFVGALPPSFQANASVMATYDFNALRLVTRSPSDKETRLTAYAGASIGDTTPPFLTFTNSPTPISDNPRPFGDPQLGSRHAPNAYVGISGQRPPISDTLHIYLPGDRELRLGGATMREFLEAGYSGGESYLLIGAGSDLLKYLKDNSEVFRMGVAVGVIAGYGNTVRYRFSADPAEVIKELSRLGRGIAGIFKR